MTQALPNLFQRHDTFFGIFEGLGQDFGINPLWLRLGFVMPLFFFPFQTITAYLGLGVVVFASRWMFPDKVVAAPVEVEAPAAVEAPKPAIQPDGANREMALAA